MASLAQLYNLIKNIIDMNISEAVVNKKQINDLLTCSASNCDKIGISCCGKCKAVKRSGIFYTCVKIQGVQRNAIDEVIENLGYRIFAKRLGSS